MIAALWFLLVVFALWEWVIPALLNDMADFADWLADKLEK